ncbi:hypothetical protein F5Y17DRAFT_455440 [Xylariaceae sp. FL0594]|nr:hypothetical protein F5Y17DRAFT_455440 [Xylariaceae sp. FL0594]
MYFSESLIVLVAAALQATASPVSTQANELEPRNASGCNYFAAPRCCVPTVCQCANGHIYLVNQDNVNRGLDGCDPPWGYIADSNSQFPGYCC